MAISTTTKLYAVEDCKISQLTADSAGSASATYAASVDVPGIREVGFSGDMTSVELRGDNTLLDSNSSLSSITISVEHAKLSQDVLDIILGGSVTAGGSGTTETNTFLRKGTDTLNYFKLEAKTPTDGGDIIGGDVHFVAWKCILSSFPDIGLANEDYKIVSFECKAIPTISNSDWFSVVEYETATAIS